MPVSGLTLDVIKPAVIDPDVKLPVAVVSASDSRLSPFSNLLTLHPSGSSEVCISTRRTIIQMTLTFPAFSSYRQLPVWRHCKEQWHFTIIRTGGTCYIRGDELPVS